MRHYESKCFKGIDDLPVYLWDKIHSTDNYAFLLLGSTTYIYRKQPHLLKRYALSLIWRKIYDEYITEFGFSDNFLACIRKRKELMKYRVRKIETGDKNLETFIKICEVELEGLEQQGAGGSFLDTKAWVEQAMGIRINGKECSVKEFYGYVRYLSTKFKAKKNG